MPRSVQVLHLGHTTNGNLSALSPALWCIIRYTVLDLVFLGRAVSADCRTRLIPDLAVEFKKKLVQVGWGCVPCSDLVKSYLIHLIPGDTHAGLI